METIPRVLHVTWKTRTLPSWGNECVETWARFHPSWTLRVWTDDDHASALARAGAPARAAYAALPAGAARADVARYAILSAHGGVYADLDAQCLRSLEPLLAAYDGRRVALVGRETERGKCGNAVLASTRGHPLWRDVLRRCASRVAAAVAAGADWDAAAVCACSGPGVLSAAVDASRADVEVLAVDAFYPVAWRPADAYGLLDVAAAEDAVRRGAYCAHLWRGSWWADTADHARAARGYFAHYAKQRGLGGDAVAAAAPGAPTGFRAFAAAFAAGRSALPARAVAAATSRGAVFNGAESFSAAAAAAVAAAVAGAGARTGNLVSVVAPTTSSRARFHAACYAAFAAQTHEPRELIVVDSGPVASPFFAWLVDPRVSYVRVDCSDETAPSIGAKRSLAVAAYARGAILAHFDDDDAYAPAYLATLLGALAERNALAAKLRAWYVVDATTAGEVPRVLRFDGARCERAVLSFGFSLVYRFEAFALAAGFPDISWGEDAAFLRKLLTLAGPRSLALVADSVGLCAHVLHPGNRSREFEVAECDGVDAAFLLGAWGGFAPYLRKRAGPVRRSPAALRRMERRRAAALRAPDPP